MGKRKSKRKGGRKTGRKWLKWSPLSRKSSTSSEDDEIQAQEGDHTLNGAAKEETVPVPTTDSISSSDVPRETPTDEVEMDKKDVLVKGVEENQGPSTSGASTNVYRRSPNVSECTEEDHHLQEGQRSSEHLLKDDKRGKITSPSTTTTVYLAAPTSHTLAFVGENVGWKNPHGTFELVKKIEPDFGIFRGVIPVPSRKRSQFKFALVESNGNIKYEGNTSLDNREDELQMDSVYFFIFKPRTQNFLYKIGDAWNDTFGKSKTETRQEIMVEFLSLVFDRALEKVPSDWDAAFDILSDGLQKLRRLQCDEFRDGLRKFVFGRLQLPFNFNHIFLMVIGVHLTSTVFPNALKEILQLHADPFSRYLFEFQGKIVRNKELKHRVLIETLAVQGGADYWWILFRLNSHNEHLKNIKPKDVEDALIKSLTVFPEPLLGQEIVAARVVNCLLRCDDLDGIYDRLLPVLDKSLQYKPLVDRLLLKSILVLDKDVDGLIQIMCSKFLKGFGQHERAEDSDSSFLDQDCLKAFFSSLFYRPFTDIILLACSIPDYFLSFLTPIAEAAVERKMEALLYLNAEDIKCYSKLQPSLLSKFPLIQKMIDDAFLRITSQQLDSGSFLNIPSLELTLQGLAMRLVNVPFLEQPSLADLQRSVTSLPRNYFKNLHIALKDKDLRAHQTEETKDIVEAVENHFELVYEIVNQVRSRRISLKDVENLQDLHVADYLKYVGLEERLLSDIRKQIEELRKRHELFSGLYEKFGRLNLVQTGSSTTSEEVELINEDVEMIHDGEEVEYKALEPIQVLDPEDWESYLNDINDQSVLLLQDALSLPTPAFTVEAVWLNKVKDCTLFSEMIWYYSVKKVTSSPLGRGDLSSLIQDCAVRWKDLAQRVADGNLPFQDMEKVIRLEPDAKLLAQAHLQLDRSLQIVNESYRDFKILQKLQHLIGPFVASLRLFKITRREEIDALYEYINNHLMQNWAESTLVQVRESGIIEMIKGVLQIDPEKPETMSPLELIGSLITNKSNGSSPLVEWLRKKKPQDMEAMGKILQGTLLEAYGQLQTLRTRIAPFLDREFETYQHLLNVVRETEQRFAQRIGSRVQPIKCPWLANMLPEIDAAVRASVISPAEDAKEKLAKLSRVIIDVRDEDGYKIEIELEPTGSLSMDELKQAFQLLDMSTTDDTDASIKMRKSVGLILRLDEVFAALFACGSNTYSLQSKKITMENLDREIQEMQRQLSVWKELWKEVEQLPLLALFSRSYLLHLADLIRKREQMIIFTILRVLLPSATGKLWRFVDRLVLLVHESIPINDDEDAFVSTEQLLFVLRKLHDLIQLVYFKKGVELNLPTFLTSFGRSLRSHFIDKSVEILNVSKDLVAGSALAAYISFTGMSVEPSRILFVTANTSEEEVKRFMALWSLPDHSSDEIFIIVHIQRLSASAAGIVRDAVGMVLPEKQTKLLLLAQQHNRVQATKSLGARLGLVSDRLLDINFTAGQLSECLSKLLPETSKMCFFTSKLPGCGKSQQVMRLVAELVPRPDYFRIPIRLGTVEELLGGLKKVEKVSQYYNFIHLDVAHSTSLELNDLLLSLLIHGALYNPNKAKLGFWSISDRTTIAIEFASPFGAEEFPVIGYLGQHSICECTETTFSYELAAMPRVIGQKIVVSKVPGTALVAAAKFLRIKEAGIQGLAQWDAICAQPDTIVANPLPKGEAFRYLVGAFHHTENRQAPTFSALNAMASFIYRHISAMLKSMWFNESAIFLFGDNEQLAQLFKTNVFDLLLRVANDSVTRSWSILQKGQKQPEMDWIHRQRALFLLGLNEDGEIMGMNIVGRDKVALKAMFHPALLPFLEAQCLQFQELKGFKNLLPSPEGTQLIINAMRSLLLLDGTARSVAKVLQLDSHLRNTPAIQLLRELIGKDLGYVLTGDNITKMMFALYRIRCGLPVIAFGEAGVGKSALFRFLIQSLLGHEFRVCNVNSGTTVQDVAAMVGKAINKLTIEPNAQVFLLFDEMNTADSPVIAFFKELMLDRHCDGRVLPDNIHILAAANPYRSLIESDKEATVGLAFRFASSDKNDSISSAHDNRNLVYRVNELPLSFYDHIYDFGHLNDEAESTYIEEICQHSLPKTSAGMVQDFVTLLRKSHLAARAMSPDPDSAVSLRDTTRAAQLFRWFCDSRAGQNLAYNQRIAVELSIYLVYAFRFKVKERALFLENVFGVNQRASRSMMEASKKIANTLYEEVHGASIRSGAIALNEALCENLFALYVCVLNGIFLIIVGRPGSSKSLSVEILKLVLYAGNHTLRQKLGDLPAITELYFQCSPLSTSSGFKALFESAQRLSLDPKTMLAMVVLDELGLADLSPEKPIKVLHSELERKAVLTSGEQQQSPYSVVALSNWVVDAAQLNRGILISRTQAESDDLLHSSVQLAETLILKYSRDTTNVTNRLRDMLIIYLRCIVNTYEVLDSDTQIGGGHFFSMRDFFFCVKNFVCSILQTTQHGRLGAGNLNISDNHLIQSIIRNFGGHEQAQQVVRQCWATWLDVDVASIPPSPPLDLIVQNINDSSKKLSVHIARHLMILNRSMIGLQLLNHHVKHRLNEGLGWHVIFGSCFPGDLQVMAVTRKLRQVEQAIRSGGVLILCHAEQLFESLYMVLNQQYWAQDEVMMTQIALGPSSRAIVLPEGPFRIIALQDIDTALNRNLMSPAVLSRFEKHELRPSHLLKDKGEIYLYQIESHPVWMAVPELIKRKKLLYGYHEESFATLALHLQEVNDPMEVDGEVEDYIPVQWIRAVNPMAMIKLEREARNNEELLKICRQYRKDCILEGIDDAMDKMSSSRRMVVMTNTLRHLEVSPRHAQSFVIRLFDIQTELELHSMLDSVKKEDRNNPDYCIFIQYDATTGPIEQFQITKYEIDTRMEGAKCRIAFIVHVDPRPGNMRWVFSFGDGWDYAFVDELVPIDQSFPAGQRRLPLSELVNSPVDRSIAEFIEPMTEEAFRSLLLEMLGPNLQTSLSHLRSSLGPFYSGVRGALGLPDNHRLIRILKECLVSQLTHDRVTWNVVEVVSDPNFDSSSSLMEGLWGAYKTKVSTPLAHLLLTSDVCKVSNLGTMSLWCDFVDANYPDRRMLLNSNESFVPIPVGFRFCSQPFGRFLVSFDAENQDQNVNGALRWLFDYIAHSKDSVNLKKVYFKDWLLLHIPPHLHSCLELLPLEKMLDVVDSLFEDQPTFFQEWKRYKADVVAALELLSITMYASTEEFPWNTGFGTIHNWEEFFKSAVRLSMTVLAKPAAIQNQKKWIQSISSIEISTALGDLLDRVKDVPQLWLGLRITKRMLLFDPNCQVKLPDLLGSSVEQLIQNLTELVLDSIIRPRLIADGESRRAIRQVDLYALLNIAAVCSSSEELFKKLRTCPTTNSLVPFDAYRDAQRNEKCPCCNHQLLTLVVTVEESAEAEVGYIHHLVEPEFAAVESLFQDHLKFLFFFERVAELFVHHQRNHPDNIHEFLNHLLVERTHLRVSWRFLTVVLKSVLSTRFGSATIDSLLANIHCNALSKELNSNTQSFLRALLARADEEVRSHVRQDRPRLFTSEDWNQSIMKNEWTVERIRLLAVIREALNSGRSQVATDALNEWTRFRRNGHDPATTEAFLFFVLYFSSTGGDETKLQALFERHQANQELGRHPIIQPYMFKLMSPLSLGFDLLPAGMRTQQFEERLSNRLPLNDILQYYHFLQELEPDWAPYIARLALHTADVAENKEISFLRELLTNPSLAAQSYMPGIDNHPYLPSFMLEGFRWYICECGIPNFVGNCGEPTHQSICMSCRVALAGQMHRPRPGVRRATPADFQAPRGIAMSRIPSPAPNFTVRNKPPIVTRFCLLLNYLALMNAALDPHTLNEVIVQLMRSLAVGERQQQEDRRSFIRFLASQIIVHLDLLCQLLVANRPRLTRPDQFRIGHFVLHKLLTFQNVNLSVNAQQFVASPLIREAYENELAQLLSGMYNFELELDRMTERSDEASSAFRRSLTESQTNYWSYAYLASSNRASVQLFLARDEQLRQRYRFLDLLLDENWSNKLDALKHLGNAMRFIALVRTVLQGSITLNEANRMTIDQGLSKMIELVEQKAVLLDRGRSVSTQEHVNQLFQGFKSLWDRFSHIPNLEHKTFLDYFECQEVNLNIRPRTILDESAPLILILAGTGLSETTFACQLLSHAVETAASIAQMTFVQPGCRAKSGRVQLSVSSAAVLADFDDSLFAHVSAQRVDEFISDHVIDQDTLGLAETFAMAAVLGPAGSTIVQDLSLEIVGEFYFKDNRESETFLSSLERRFLPWQPTGIPADLLNRIVGDLEKNRNLSEAKAVLISAIIHLVSNTDPLEIAKMRQSPISDTLDRMERIGILTEQHLSATTTSALNRFIKLEVRHAFGLLKGIISRMRDDNIFSGRVPAGWDTHLDERTAEMTRKTMRSSGADIVDSLLQMVNIVSSSEPVPEILLPDKSLLLALQEIEGCNWKGIQSELKMKHLGHVLLLAEALLEE